MKITKQIKYMSPDGTCFLLCWFFRYSSAFVAVPTTVEAVMILTILTCLSLIRDAKSTGSYASLDAALVAPPHNWH